MGGDVLWPSRLASWMAYLDLGSSAMVVSGVWGLKLGWLSRDGLDAEARWCLAAGGFCRCWG
jgi:hypothetical protein